MVPFIILLIGYIILPFAFWYVDTNGINSFSTAICAILFAISITGNIFAWIKKKYLLLGLPLLGFSLFLIITLMIIKI